MLPSVLIAVAVLNQIQLNQVWSSIRVGLIVIVIIGSLLGFGQSVEWYKSSSRQYIYSKQVEPDTPEVLKLRNYRWLLVVICLTIIGVLLFSFITTGNVQLMVLKSMTMLLPAGVAIMALFGSMAVSLTFFMWRLAKRRHLQD